MRPKAQKVEIRKYQCTFCGGWFWVDRAFMESEFSTGQVDCCPFCGECTENHHTLFIIAQATEIASKKISGRQQI